MKEKKLLLGLDKKTGKPIEIILHDDPSTNTSTNVSLIMQTYFELMKKCEDTKQKIEENTIKCPECRGNLSFTYIPRDKLQLITCYSCDLGFELVLK